MKETQALSQYLTLEPAVALGFLHGSFAREMHTEESDVDVAVYLRDKEQEDRIWREVTALLKREVDLICLNDAPTSLVSNVFKTGIPLALKDRNLYWQLYLETTMEAEDFLNFARSYRDISLRSLSLSPEDETRLLERIQFLEEELSETDRFRAMTLEEYRAERSKRRDIERWTENIMNAAIDIAKIVLACEKKTMPKTYQEALRDFALFAGLDTGKAEQFSECARLRNILAHEYLDILYGRIRGFISVFPELYGEIAEFLHSYLGASRNGSASRA